MGLSVGKRISINGVSCRIGLTGGAAAVGEVTVGGGGGKDAVQGYVTACTDCFGGIDGIYRTAGKRGGGVDYSVFRAGASSIARNHSPQDTRNGRSGERHPSLLVLFPAAGVLPLSRLLCCAFILMAGCASQARVTVPVGEHLLAAPPAGWVQVSGTQTSTFRLAEFVPAGGTGDATGVDASSTASWSQKISIERLLGTPVVDPIEFLDSLARDTDRSCPDGAFHPVSSGLENGYATAVALLTCPRLALADAGQLTMIKVIQGRDALYTISRAIRTDPFPPGDDGKPAEQPVDHEVIGGFSVYLRAITVCDPSRAEHPCPPATESP